MPVRSAHGLCTALGRSGLIYMAASKQQSGMTQLFTFNTTSREFTELPSVNVEKRYMVCDVVKLYWEAVEEERFIMIGGGV